MEEAEAGPQTWEDVVELFQDWRVWIVAFIVLILALAFIVAPIVKSLWGFDF